MKLIDVVIKKINSAKRSVMIAFEHDGATYNTAGLLFTTLAGWQCCFDEDETCYDVEGCPAPVVFDACRAEIMAVLIAEKNKL